MSYKRRTGRGRLLMLAISDILMVVACGCAATPAAPLSIEPVAGTCEVLIEGPLAIGRMRLWVPEAILSETGVCAVYPVGGEWVRAGTTLSQDVHPAGNIGPGNFVPAGDGMLECAGIRMPQDSAVSWHTEVTAHADAVRFKIRLTNTSEKLIRKAGAAICLKFADGSWWRDDHVFVRSGGAARSLGELGRNAGPDNGFEAYLLAGESFDHVFYIEFWGFNRHRLDVPRMVASHPDAGCCVEISGSRAYFLHSNRGNPCEDIMLAFGDLPPGASAESTGRVRLAQGDAQRVLVGP